MTPTKGQEIANLNNGDLTEKNEQNLQESGAEKSSAPEADEQPETKEPTKHDERKEELKDPRDLQDIE